jgi:hypothetical protein
MGLFKNSFYFFDEKITKNRHGCLVISWIASPQATRNDEATI